MNNPSEAAPREKKLSTPAVSVVMPCFNAAGTLETAIESIQNQTFQDWELIIVDDGSLDDSLSVMKSAAASDERLRLVGQAHSGIVRALQAGCALARGSFIARMDADDIAQPERLARQYTYMQEHPDVALCGTHVSMFGGRIGVGRARYEAWINGLRSHGDIARELFIECPVAHPTFFLRRAPFERAGGYEEHGWAEDYDSCMRLFLAGARFGVVPDPLLRWRESPGRLSMTAERYSPARFRALKRFYLARSYLRGRKRFHQWGAGEVGKVWLREWEDLRPEAVVDINPRKIGRKIHGVRVIAPDELPEPGLTFTLIAVGAPGARDEIRAWLKPRGYIELQDFLFVA
ncbi:MAG TPA: glycosyltransferase [Candidatus Hydrogenedentes bacterium]|nr:glycosyltransferase [Candidatus Hydrogenedentota bacterium]